MALLLAVLLVISYLYLLSMKYHGHFKGMDLENSGLQGARVSVCLGFTVFGRKRKNTTGVRGRPHVRSFISFKRFQRFNTSETPNPLDTPLNPRAASATRTRNATKPNPCARTQTGLNPEAPRPGKPNTVSLDRQLLHGLNHEILSTANPKPSKSYIPTSHMHP